MIIKTATKERGEIQLRPTIHKSKMGWFSIRNNSI
jgi:hypothetical protein